MIKNTAYTILFSFFFVCFICNKYSNKIFADVVDPMSIVSVKNMAILPINPNISIPSVKDTILQQLGGKLYFLDSLETSDSITVLEVIHNFSREFGKYSQYKFIIHNKNTPFHKRFTSETLDNVYKAYFIKKQPYHDPLRFSASFNTEIEKQKKDISSIKIDPLIHNYKGYWIYLSKYKGQFYIDDHWAWLGSFHISDSLLTKHYMDGPTPFVIESFKIKGNGNFYLNDELYELIDKNLYIYKHAGMYIVPAWNVHKFEIIEYANNTGNLIASTYCDID